MFDDWEIFVGIFETTKPSILPKTFKNEDELMLYWELHHAKLMDAIWLRAQAAANIGVANRSRRIELCDRQVAKLTLILKHLLSKMDVQQRSLCWIKSNSEKWRMEHLKE